MTGPLVEIAGIAGTGKSSVGHVLRNRWDPPLACYRVPRLRSLPHFASSIARSLPNLMDAQGWNEALRESLRLMHFEATAADLAGRRRGRRPEILDQGPVYAYTLACRQAGLGTMQDWLLQRLEHAFDRVAPALDAVVLLDAPDSVLLERIGARDKRHEIEDYDRAGGVRFLTEFRAQFETTLGRLETRHQTRVVRVHSDGCSVEATALEVARALAAGCCRLTP